MVVSILSASMIGGNNDHPFFIKMASLYFTASQMRATCSSALRTYSSKNAPLPAICPASSVYHKYTQLRSGASVRIPSAASFEILFVYIENMQILLFFRKTDAVQIVTVFYIINLEIVCFLFPLPNQNCPVIRPTGIDSRFIFFGGCSFGNPKDRPVIVIRFSGRNCLLRYAY